MSGEANLERYDDGGQEVYKSVFRSLKGLKQVRKESGTGIYEISK